MLVVAERSKRQVVALEIGVRVPSTNPTHQTPEVAHRRYTQMATPTTTTEHTMEQLVGKMLQDIRGVVLDLERLPKETYSDEVYQTARDIKEALDGLYDDARSLYEQAVAAAAF